MTFAAVCAEHNDYATWAAAAGTFLAAVAAVGIAIYIDRKQAKRDYASRHRKAVAMSTVLHRELTSLAGKVAVLRNADAATGSGLDALGTGSLPALDDAALGIKNLNTHSLERFADAFECFAPYTAGLLGLALASVYALQETMQLPPGLTDGDARLALRLIAVSATTTLPTIFAALDSLRPLILEAGFIVVESQEIKRTMERQRV